MRNLKTVKTILVPFVPCLSLADGGAGVARFSLLLSVGVLVIFGIVTIFLQLKYRTGLVWLLYPSYIIVALFGLYWIQVVAHGLRFQTRDSQVSAQPGS